MTVLRTQLAGLARRPARLLLTGLALIVAATVVFGTVLAQRITHQTILDTFSGTSANADLVIGIRTPATPEALEVVRNTPGVESATARNSVYYDVPSVPGTYLVLAGDPGRGPLSEVTLTSGTYPNAENQIAVTPRTADRMGLTVGRTIAVRLGPENPVRNLTVTGIVEPARGEGFSGIAFTTGDFVTRMSAGDSPTYEQYGIGRVEVHLVPGTDAQAVVQRLSGTLPQGIDPTGDGTAKAPIDVRIGAEVRKEEALNAASSMNELFYLVGLFVAIAAAAAALVATSTFRIVFAQRMRQLALLRAVGAGRGPLTRALIVEGALTGATAGVTGVLIAYGLGLAAGPAVRVFSDTELATPGLPILPAVLVVAGTTLIAVIAVLSPAVTAARVAPLEALRSAAVTGATARLGVVRWVFGLLLTAASLALVAIAVTMLPEPNEPSNGEGVLLATVAGGALGFFALVVLGPAVLRPVLWLVGQPLRALGPTGRLAVGAVGNAPKRAAAVSVVVALAVMLVAGALVTLSTARTTMEEELALMAPADIQIAADAGKTVPTAAVEAARAHPELTNVIPFRLAEANIPIVSENGERGNPARPIADLSLTALSTRDDIRVTEGSLDDLGPGKAVALDFADQFTGSLGYGETTTITHEGRSIQVTVVATVSGLPMDTWALLDPADLTALGFAPEPTTLLADAADDETAAYQAAVTLSPGLGVVVLTDERDELARQLLIITIVALGLVGMTVSVAVVGVGTTTALSVVERLREAGLLRAVGMSRGRLRATLLLEASLYGVVGSLLGLALAIPFAWLMLSGVGLDAPLTLPWGELALVVLILGILTALSGVLPARRASRVAPTAALAMD
ncbi:FtsX-like permease family protein [Catenuloplanes atrovinosus]|uniref:ABC transport system permease protein n=1 Tax=Catenuloplanes atrovinosus TaxID=137266 RepID=A0AAE4CA67_9ACTN|nr:FtsX-like permease family protein [Catenuloplanes atrovinosus]MDR7276567.1 putative ABC transport system permease protein [Catenuloplanes atrovinosus]